jgi:2-haloacid dehalogenase
MDFNTYEVLTFDCYGTLIDWERGILDGIKPVLHEQGITIEEDYILEQYAAIEASLEETTYKPYKELLKSVVIKIGERLNFSPTENESHCLSVSLKHWPPFPDTVEALKKLKKRYKLAIISNIDDDLFAHSQKHLEVTFDWIITAEQVKSYKPSHQNFHEAMKRIGIPKERILHVAQSIYHDIIPAKALGLNTVWVNRRKGMTGSGATKPAAETPDLEVPDLMTLVRRMGL